MHFSESLCEQIPDQCFISIYCEVAEVKQTSQTPDLIGSVRTTKTMQPAYLHAVSLMVLYQVIPPHNDILAFRDICGYTQLQDFF